MTDNSIKASGTVYTKSEKNKEETVTTENTKAKDVTITFKYKVTGDETEKDGSILLNGDITTVTTTKDGKFVGLSIEMKNVSSQGSSYKDVSTTLNDTGFTSGTVDGTEVNSSLLNGTEKLYSGLMNFMTSTSN